MVNHKKLSMAVAGACALFGASAANAFGPIKAGDWDLSVGGEVNAFYSYTHCDNNANSIKQIVGVACTTTNTNNVSSIESGLLPSALVFSAKTTQEGFDIGVTFGFYPGINNGGQVGGANSPGANIALGSTGIDMRQNFLTFGDKEMGTIKMGRDLGLFGSDAILSDMTLLGVGTNQAAVAPGNTTLGRIGVGYIYADWIPQITYISTNSMGGVSGLQGSIGIFQPLMMISIDGGTVTNHSLPAFQAKATYDYDFGDVKGRAWVGGVWQRSMRAAGENSSPATVGIVGGVPAVIPASTSALDTTNQGVTAYAGEVGVKASVAGFSGVLYVYQGRGVGTTGLFFDGIDALGNKRNSNGGYAQLQYQMGKWKPGISYGFSRLATASGESPATNPTLVNFNRSAVAQLQYSLTKALTLVGEYAITKTSSQLSTGGGGKNLETSISAGAILFF